MIVGLYQCASPAGDLDAGFDTLRTALDLAAASRVDMLVLPELILPGYAATGSEAPDGWAGVTDQIAAMCRDAGVGVTLGLPDYTDGHVYNAAMSFGAQGERLATYRKIQLFGPREQAVFAPGDRYVVFDYRGTRFGLLICYDVEFPEHVRALARRGATVILVPTANMMPFVNVNQVMVPARAAENGVTVVYANYCGSEADLDYVGLSGIFGPDGYSLATKGHSPGLCIADLPEGDWAEHDIPASTQIADLRVPPDVG